MRRAYLRTAPALLTVLAACASGAPVGGRAPVPQSIGIAGSGDRLTISPGDGPNRYSLDAPLDRVWRALPAAFDSVGVRVTRIDSVSKVVANDGFKVRQRLGQVALSRYIDCGQTQIGPNADSYEVYITLIAEIRFSTAATTAMATTFEAAARPIAFSQGYSRCTSRGTFEAKLLEAIKAQLPR